MSTTEGAQQGSSEVMAAARWAGRLVGESGWLAERARDAVRWPAELVLRFPKRARRLAAALADAKAARPLLLPQAEPAVKSWARPVARAWPQVAPAALGPLMLGSRLFDLAGGPELAEFLLRALTHATPLTTQERAAGQEALGQDAVRWDDVRIAEGGMLRAFFSANGGRAFTFYHTINLPPEGRHARPFTDIVVHELVHVYQYEHVGGTYILEALYAQGTDRNYDYGKEAGLGRAWAEGRGFKTFNREQQAQIVQDYYCLLHPAPGDLRTDGERRLAQPAYEPFVEQCRQALI